MARMMGHDLTTHIKDYGTWVDDDSASRSVAAAVASGPRELPT